MNKPMFNVQCSMFNVRTLKYKVLAFGVWCLGFADCGFGVVWLVKNSAKVSDLSTESTIGSNYLTSQVIFINSFYTVCERVFGICKQVIIVIIHLFRVVLSTSSPLPNVATKNLIKGAI